MSWTEQRFRDLVRVTHDGQLRVTTDGQLRVALTAAPHSWPVEGEQPTPWTPQSQQSPDWQEQ